MILAVDANGGIGKDGKLPWHIPSELKYFKYYTEGCTCVMGRKTYEDIKGFKKTTSGPLLPNRSCIVITHDVRAMEAENVYDNVYFNDDPETLIEMMRLSQRLEDEVQDFCIIGGKSIYELFAKSDILDEISVTVLSQSFDCDTFVNVTSLTRNHELFCTHLGPELWDVNIYRRKDEKW